MPHRLSGVLICLLVSVVGWAQGESVLSHTESFALKVALAEKLGIDTLSDFRIQEAHYRKLLNEEVKETNSSNVALQRCEWFKISSITRPLSQHASSALEKEEKQRMDSIYNALLGGEDFKALASRYSLNSSDGESEWIPEIYLLQEWNSILKNLKKDEVSLPFYSPVGIHIVRWEARGLRNENLSSTKGVSVQEWTQLREALMVATLEKKYRKPLMFTEKDLEDYFEDHKKTYSWELPHYKGAVVHCRNKKEAKRIRKWLKKHPFETWEKHFNQVTAGMEQPPYMECGLYQIGTNEYIDKLVFKCGDFEPLEDLPYSFVVGKKLKKGPKNYLDVRDAVVKDYLSEHQNDWLNELKTVNMSEVIE